KAKGYNIEIVGDTAGKPGGAVYQHWAMTKTPSNCLTVKPVKLAVKATETVTLPGGKTYWVVLMPTGYDTKNLWFAGMLTSGTHIGTSLNSADGARTWASSSVSLALDIYQR